MAIQLTDYSYDLTLLCITTIDVMMVCSYVMFAFLVTHRGDFYQRRLWKAAIWFAGVATGILAAAFLSFSIATAISNMSSISAFKVIVATILAFLGVLSIAVPYLFIVTWGTHHQLKWWLNSDDYLDKIWKDPNKGHRSTIREL